MFYTYKLQKEEPDHKRCQLQSLFFLNDFLLSDSSMFAELVINTESPENVQWRGGDERAAGPVVLMWLSR